MRGDEPVVQPKPQAGDPEFPACAGMNRLTRTDFAFYSRVPRMRGDEPKQHAISPFLEGSSPHARG